MPVKSLLPSQGSVLPSPTSYPASGYQGTQKKPKKEYESSRTMQKANPRLAALDSDCMDVNGRSHPLKDKNVAGEMAKSVLALQA